jgi:hypothetical protein
MEMEMEMEIPALAVSSQARAHYTFHISHYALRDCFT